MICYADNREEFPTTFPGALFRLLCRLCAYTEARQYSKAAYGRALGIQITTGAFGGSGSRDAGFGEVPRVESM